MLNKIDEMSLAPKRFKISQDSYNLAQKTLYLWFSTTKEYFSGS